MGSTLRMDTSNISDPDGMTNSTLRYYWFFSPPGSNGYGGSNGGPEYTLTRRDAWMTLQARVTFTDDAGTRETVKSATIAVVPPDSSLTRNLRATINLDGTVTLTWDTPEEGSVTGYRIFRHFPQEGEDPLVYVPDTGSTETTYTDTNVTVGTQYAYRVVAIFSSVLGLPSNSVTVVPEINSESQEEEK